MNSFGIDGKDVRIGRLEKKVRKLIKQRDHWKEQSDKKDLILRYYPYAEKRHSDYMKQRAMEEELNSLRKRVREQEIAITSLQGKY